MIKIIVAYSHRRGIGIENKLPWNLRADIKNFKYQTIGNGNNSVIMGRRTWESLPKAVRPLPDRHNIIVSSSMINSAEIFPNSKVVSTVAKALEYSQRKAFDVTWGIGGAEIYSDMIRNSKVDEVHLTNIDNDIPCDTFFPDISDYYHTIQRGPWRKENELKYRFEIHRNPKCYALGGWVA